MGSIRADITVFEVSQGRAGAFAGKLLADAGCSVQVLPAPGRSGFLPENARRYMDPDKEFVATPDADAESLAVAAREVWDGADVVVTDVDPDWLDSLGLTIGATAGPTVVTLSAFGWSTSRGLRPADELLMQAASGVMHMVGSPDREPLALPYGIGSIQLGLHGAAATTMAVSPDASADRPRHIDIAGVDVLASYVRIYGAVARYYSIPLVRDGRRAPGSGGRYPFSLFHCADGHVAIICRSASEWQNFLAMMGNPDWAKEPRYADMYAIAMTYPEEVDDLVEAWLADKDREQLQQMAHEFRVPLAPVRTVSEVMGDKQLAARDFFDELAVEGRGTFVVPGRPWGSGSRALQSAT